MRIFCSKITAKNGSGHSTGSKTVYALLAYALEIMYGIKTMPEIEKTTNGKPFFRDLPHIMFSLSHSITHVLCAVASFPVGADIESPRTISTRAAKFFSSPEELLQFEPAELWVLKESWIKLYGSRLSDINKISFIRDGGIILTQNPAVRAALYTICSCHAAICCTGGEPARRIEVVSLD